MFLEVTYQKRTVAVEEHETPATAYEALSNVFVPALLALGFAESSIADACSQYADEHFPPLSEAEKEFFDQPFFDENITIGITDEHGKVWCEDDGTPVEISLSQGDFLILLDDANKAGLPFDRFLEKIITDHLTNLLGKHKSCDCDGCEPGEGCNG